MLLDDAHSPGMTDKYVKMLDGNRRAVVEVISSGRVDDHSVHSREEQGVTAPHEEGETIRGTDEVITEHKSEREAYDAAYRVMHNWRTESARSDDPLGFSELGFGNNAGDPRDSSGDSWL